MREYSHMTTQRQQAQPIDGVTGLLDLFDRFPLVALGEMHGVEQGAQFIEALVRHPTFSERATAIVVEFGNAFHQQVVDDYIAGGDVELFALRGVWQDLLGAGPWGFREAIYPSFFASVRAVNESLPEARRIRVLLGDPPVNWKAVRTRADLDAFADRDGHFARVVVDDVLRTGQRALLLAGAFHLLRAEPFISPTPHAAPMNLVQRLEHEYPGSTYVVVPHSDISEPERVEIERQLASWPTPCIAAIRGTWLQDVSAYSVFGQCITWVLPDGTTKRPVASPGLTLGDLFDAYLYLGPIAELTNADENHRPLDDEDAAEVARRKAFFAPLYQDD